MTQRENKFPKAQTFVLIRCLNPVLEIEDSTIKFNSKIMVYTLKSYYV